MKHSLTKGFVALLAVVVTLLAAGASSARAAAALPEGFSDQLVTFVTAPTAIAWTSDGRMLIDSKTGALRIFESGTLLPTPALDLTAKICSNGERGLLGAAVDPQFPTNHYIYLYYTFDKQGNQACATTGSSTPVNRVSRFVLGDNDIVDPFSETVLIDNIPSPSGIHIAGDVDFGKDGNLYISVGEGGCDWRGDSGCGLVNDAARDLGGLVGKILRITPDGGIPSDNPFTDGETDRCNITGSTTTNRVCREIYAYGLRNPWRTAFDINAPGTRFFINDVGERRWEEINQGAAGADFGWNVREGACVRDSYTDCGLPPLGMTNPLYSYPHTNVDGCTSVTAGDFVPRGLWPQQYDNAYLYGDSVCGKLYTLTPDGGGGYTSALFGSEMLAMVDGRFGPDGSGTAFYYLQFTAPNNQIRKIVYLGQANRPPIAALTAARTSGDLPLTADFDGSGSSDPDNDTLTYDWDFGDGSPHGSGVTVSHTYTVTGTYTATLTVNDGRGATDTATSQIYAGDNPPTPTIQTPAAGVQFAAGDTLTLTGGATDAEDGQLPDTSLSWTVLRHHNTHTHPYLSPTSGNELQITAPAPEDLEAATNSYLEIYLTATDSRGLSKTVMQTMDPKKVNLSFETVPTGFELEVAGSRITAPLTVTSWQNWSIPIIAPNQDDDDEVPWRFQAWSDGGAQEHTIVTGANPVTYTAIMKRVDYPRPGGATPLRVPLVPAFSACTNPNTTHVVPLAYQSCTPPVLKSPLLTTSAIGSGSGSVRLNVIAGNPSTPADEADVSISGSATDVRRKSDGTDYTGSVLLSTLMRITDRGSGSSGLVPGTVSDIRFSVPFNCVATASTSIGGSCTLGTTLDTLLPGMAREGKRTILSTFAFELDDAGPDGSILPPSGTCPPTCGSGDESVYLRQGLFVP